MDNESGLRDHVICRQWGPCERLAQLCCDAHQRQRRPSGTVERWTTKVTVVRWAQILLKSAPESRGLQIWENMRRDGTTPTSTPSPTPRPCLVSRGICYSDAFCRHCPQYPSNYESSHDEVATMASTPRPHEAVPHHRAVAARGGEVATPPRTGPEGPVFLESTPDPLGERRAPVLIAMTKRYSLFDFLSPKGFKSNYPHQG